MTKQKHIHTTDIAVIGGGASGLAAALAAARCGAAVTILEKLNRMGKKLLATGNGRCNLGNLSQDPIHYHGSIDINPVFAAFPGETAFFRSLGLMAQPDEAGRLYPVSGQAASVLDALRLACAQLGVREMCDFDIREIEADSSGYIIRPQGKDAIVPARRVILAAGGCAAPKFGTDGSGFRLAQSLGHQTTDLYPVLSPISLKDPRPLRALKGLRVSARVSALRDGRVIASEEGQVHFGDRAISGICAFNLAGHRPDTLALDLLPRCDDPMGLLTEIMEIRAAAPLEDLLTGLFPKRIGQVLLSTCTDRPLREPVSALEPGARKALAALVKNWQFPTISGTDWDAAQVTAGGVSDVEPTLQSPHRRGIYFAGEILDVHGDTGGFNLRWAWASGLMAGEQAARGLYT